MNTFANRVPSMRPIIWKSLFLTVTLVLMTVLTVAPASAQATTTTNNFQTSIDIVAFVPCAAGGDGEWVFSSGTLHGVSVTTIDDTGVFHTELHFQPQGIRGEGLTTGTTTNGRARHRRPSMARSVMRTRLSVIIGSLARDRIITY